MQHAQGSQPLQHTPARALGTFPLRWNLIITSQGCEEMDSARELRAHAGQNREDSVCVQPFLVVRWDRPGLKASFATFQLMTSGKSAKWEQQCPRLGGSWEASEEGQLRPQ